MKLTELQHFRIREAHRHLESVCREIKQRNLKKNDVEDMKHIEQLVIETETAMVVNSCK